MWVNYRLKSQPGLDGRIIIDGLWTTEAPDTYRLTYDEDTQMYTAAVLQKQGYYSYQYLLENRDGTRRPVPSEGNFFQTENRYQALVYFKEVGGRTWHLAAYRQIIIN